MIFNMRIVHVFHSKCSCFMWFLMITRGLNIVLCKKCICFIWHIANTTDCRVLWSVEPTNVQYIRSQCDNRDPMNIISTDTGSSNCKHVLWLASHRDFTTGSLLQCCYSAVTHDIVSLHKINKHHIAPWQYALYWLNQYITKLHGSARKCQRAQALKREKCMLRHNLTLDPFMNMCIN